METKKMHELYQNIADKINEMIPDDWKKVYLYAEVLEDSSTFFFDFESLTKNKLIYYYDIPEEFNVSEKIFDDMWRNLLGLFEELHNEYKKNTPEAWTNLTLYLDNTGKFKIDYNYDEVKRSTRATRLIWKYKMFGIYPKSAFAQETVDEYIKTQETKK